MLRRAVDVGAQVQHRGRATFGVGQLAGNGRAVDAVQGFEHIAGNRHQRAGVACRHGSGGFAAFDLLNGHAHRRVFFAPQSHFHRVVHGHNLAGGHQRGARVDKALQCLGQADHQQLRIGMVIQKLTARRQRDAGAVVAPHAINSQSNHEMRCRPPVGPRLKRESAQGIKKARATDDVATGPGGRSF